MGRHRSRQSSVTLPLDVIAKNRREGRRRVEARGRSRDARVDRRDPGERPPDPGLAEAERRVRGRRCRPHEGEAGHDHAAPTTTKGARRGPRTAEGGGRASVWDLHAHSSNRAIVKAATGTRSRPVPARVPARVGSCRGRHIGHIGRWTFRHELLHVIHRQSHPPR